MPVAIYVLLAIGFLDPTWGSAARDQASGRARIRASHEPMRQQVPSKRERRNEPPIRFPRDHGAHSDAAIEWWYYTGHLRDRALREYGFQLTFFRVGEMHLAHFAWTDAAKRKFTYEEKAHLALPGIAGAEEGRLAVSNEDWSASETNGIHRLRAAGRKWQLDLTLRPAKPPVLHGSDGLSRKGPGEKEYSRYVSITRLSASGALSRDGVREALSGTAWFDHEWGPGGLPKGTAGWDWFALQLSDGSDLMLYQIRARTGGGPGPPSPLGSGSATAFSSGTFVPEKSSPQSLRWQEIQLRPTGEWVSPATRARYPSGWRIAVPSLGIDVLLDPLLPDQELVTERSTQVTYWEGACRVRGTRQGRPITGRAYAELTGYAGRDVPGIAGPGDRGTRGPPREDAGGPRAVHRAGYRLPPPASLLRRRALLPLVSPLLFGLQ